MHSGGVGGGRGGGVHEVESEEVPSGGSRPHGGVHTGGQPADGVPKEQQVEQAPNQEVSSNGRQGNDEEPELIPPYKYIVPKKTRRQESLALTWCIYWEIGLVMYTCKITVSGLQKSVGSE